MPKPLTPYLTYVLELLNKNVPLVYMILKLSLSLRNVAYSAESQAATTLWNTMLLAAAILVSEQACLMILRRARYAALSYARKKHLDELTAPYLAYILLLGGRLDDETYLKGWTSHNPDSPTSFPSAVLIARFFHKILTMRRHKYYRLGKFAIANHKQKQEHRANIVTHNNLINNIPCEICNLCEDSTAGLVVKSIPLMIL